MRRRPECLNFDFPILEKPVHCSAQFLFRHAARVCIFAEYCRSERQARIGRHVAAFASEFGEKRQKRVIGFLLAREFVKACWSIDPDKNAVLPFEVDLAAAFAIIGFHPLEGAQIFIWLGPIACFWSLKIESRPHAVIPVS